MRQERTVQGSIFNLFAKHEIVRELEAMSHGWTPIAILRRPSKVESTSDLKERQRAALQMEYGQFTWG